LLDYRDQWIPIPLSPIQLGKTVEAIAASAKAVLSAFNASKNCREKFIELRSELRTICEILESLILALTASLHYTNPRSLTTSISKFSTILNHLNKRVNQTLTGQIISNYEYQDFLTKLQHYKDTFNTAINVNCV